jgi:type II secretory pathway component PulM
MTEWKEKIFSWWSVRAPKEKTTLKLALPVIGLMLLYIVLVEPIMGVYFSRKAEYTRAQDTLTWLYDQSSLVSRMQNSCGNRVTTMQAGDTPLTLARNIARRSTINADYSEQGAAINIAVSSAPGNRMLAYVQLLACNGYEIDDLEIRRLAGGSNTVSSSFKAIPVALPSSAQ